MPSKNSTSKKPAKRTPDSARAGAVEVLNFINGKAPDFLTGSVQLLVDDACDHVGFSRLMHEPGFEKDDLHLLTNLCRRTRMMEIAELEKSKRALARHIAAIYRHPLTPPRLYNAIWDFIVDGTGLKISGLESKSGSFVDDSGSITLLDEFMWMPQTLERIIEVSNTYDEKGERDAEN